MPAGVGGDPGKIASVVRALAVKEAEKKTRIQRESNPDISRLYPWKSKKTEAERNADELVRLKL